jgi:predicted DNA-binding transcriptional regulator YafY
MGKVKNAVFTRPSMERILQIHAFIQDRKYPNCSRLAKIFETSLRTCKRDIEFMKCRLNLPLEFDMKRNGFYYAKPVPSFPQMPMSQKEIFTLLVANKAIAQYQGTPFQQVLESTFKKLTGQLNETLRYSLGSIEDVFSFRPFAPGDADAESFDVLTRAVSDRRTITFLYRNRGQTTTEERNVNPYHIAWVDGQWCLFGYDLNRKGERTFVLARLSKPKLLKGRFRLSKKFDLNEFLRGSLGLYKGKEDHEVIIELNAWAADDVRGRRLHDSQELTELAEGMLRVKLRLNSLEEIERWVLSLGTHATVVGPKALSDRVAKIGRALADKYTQSDSTME